jgi:hypothetical protein
MLQQFALFTLCPDGGDGGPMVELLELAKEEGFADSLFDMFIESDQGEGGGGGGASSCGCHHDEEQGFCCKGPCPCRLSTTGSTCQSD